MLTYMETTTNYILRNVNTNIAYEGRWDDAAEAAAFAARHRDEFPEDEWYVDRETVYAHLTRCF